MNRTKGNKMDRDEMIDFLVQLDYNYIMESANGPEYLDSILKFGNKGYFSMSTADLKEEVEQRKAMS